MYVPIQATIHQLYGSIRTVLHSERADDSDRGAVSLEQVLWFVAVGVSVVVVAAILWNKIIDQASADVVPPTAPSAG